MRLRAAAPLLLLLAACAAEPDRAPAAPGPAAAPAPGAAAAGPDEAPSAAPQDPALELLPALRPPAILLDDALLQALPLDARVAVVDSASAGLARVSSDALALAAGLRALDPPRLELADGVEGLAAIGSRVVALLELLAREDAGLVVARGRAVKDEATARARHELAAARGPPEPAAGATVQARQALAAEAAELVRERARLAAPAAELAPLPDAIPAARDAAQLETLLAPLAARELPPARADGVARAASAVRAAGSAAVSEIDRARAVRAELALRDRDARRLLDDAIGLELERHARRLEELDRALADERRREEEAARAAERQRQLDEQLARLQRTIDAATERRRVEDAAIAEIRSRTASLGAGDPAFLGYQATLEDHRRRMEAARAARDQASDELQALRRRLGDGDPEAGPLALLEDRLAQARLAWVDRRDARPLEAALKELEQAAVTIEAAARAFAADGDEARRAASAALAQAERSRTEGERRLDLIARAPEAQRPALVAIEELRALVESTRRDEERVRLDQARALDEARVRTEASLARAARLRDEARAALAEVASARRLDGGAVRRSKEELARLWRAEAPALAARLQALAATDPVAAARAHPGQLVLGVVVLLAALAARRRLHLALQRIAGRAAPDRRAFGRPGDGLLFSAGLLTRAAVPWVALVALLLAAGDALALPPGLVSRAALAAATLGAGRLLLALAGLLLRDGRVHALVGISRTDRAALHRRATLGLTVMTPAAAALVAVLGLPELFDTQVVLKATLLVTLMVTTASLLQVGREELAAHLRVRLAPDALAGPGQMLEWAKQLYNQGVERILGLVLLDALAIAVLWGAGHVATAGFLLRGTVQTVVTAAGALVIIGLSRRASRAMLDRALTQEAAGTRTRILVSMLTFFLARLVELAALAGAALSLFDAWGGDAAPIAARLLSEGTLHAFKAVGQIVAILVVAYYANRLVAYSIDAFVEQTLRAATPEIARRRDTFAPLAKSAVRYVVTMTAVIYSATVAGVDLVSIVTGLGVLGLAVAFGAQTLVKDVITGVFVIIDDDLAVGDVVKLGTIDGVVEHVGVRTTKVRTQQGVLVSVPNGQILQVENYNRGWNRAVVEMSIGHDAPVDRALAVLQEVADEYRHQRPDLLIEAPEVQGLLESAGPGIVVRVCVKTAPLAVWQVERELRLRARVAFTEQHLAVPSTYGVVRLQVDGAAAPAPAPAAPAPAEQPAVPQLILPGVAKPPVPVPVPASSVPAPVDLAAHAAEHVGGAWPVPMPAAITPPPTPAVTPPRVAPPTPLVILPGAPPSPTPPSVPPPVRPVATEKPELVLPPGVSLPEKPQTRRIVLSPEARERLADPAYVQAVTARSEPEVPPEMQASKEAIEKKRAESDAERAAALGEPAPPAPASSPSIPKPAATTSSTSIPRPPEPAPPPAAPSGNGADPRPPASNPPPVA